MHIELAKIIIDWYYSRSEKHIISENLTSAMEQLPAGLKVLVMEWVNSDFTDIVSELMGTFDETRPCYTVEVSESTYLLQ